MNRHHPVVLPLTFPPHEGPVFIAWQQPRDVVDAPPAEASETATTATRCTHSTTTTAMHAAWLLWDASVHPVHVHVPTLTRPVSSAVTASTTTATTVPDCLAATQRDVGGAKGGGPPPTGERGEIRGLLQTLAHAQHIHEQLQTLQAYRSKILQRKLAPTAPLTGTTYTETDSSYNDATTPAPLLLPPLYQYLLLARILLEWMLASETPLPLRRAIASCLIAIVERVDHSSETWLERVAGASTWTLPSTAVFHSVLESLVWIPDQNNTTRHNPSVMTGQPTASSSDSTSTSGDGSAWINPLHSLREALLWIPLERYIVQQQFDTGGSDDGDGSILTKIIVFLDHQAVWTTSSLHLQNNADERHVHCVSLANLVHKTLLLSLTPPPTVRSAVSVTRGVALSTHECVRRMQDYLWNCLAHTVMPVDCWSAIGIAYGRTLQWQWQFLPGQLHPSEPVEPTANTALPPLFKGDWRESAICIVRDIIARAREDIAFDLNRAAVYQGLTTVVPFPATTVSCTDNREANSKAVEVIADLIGDCHALLIQASDPDVRLSALKSIRSLVSRISTWHNEMGKESSGQTAINDSVSSTALCHPNKDDWIRPIVTKTLEVVLQAWENPPTRKLANAIPPLFESLIQIFLVLEATCGIDDLVQRILTQPKHRKGRYLALETLLPITGAWRLVGSSPTLLPDLLDGMADNGSNTGVIASLWTKLLYHLRLEILAKESQAGKNNTASIEPGSPTQQWLDVWVPSLVASLVELELSRRKQVAAFCLPRISTMVDATTKDASITATAITQAAFFSLVQHVASWRSDMSSRRYHQLSNRRETVTDRILWAELEVIRYASYDGLLKSSPASSPGTLRSLIATLTPPGRLKWALTHSSPPIRVAALQIVECIVPLYGLAMDTPMAHLERELDLWKYAFPFLIKEDGKEHVTSTLQCLLLFIDRLSLQEATEQRHSSVHSPPSTLPILTEFVGNFLVADVVLMKAGYPGTVAKKESFILCLLESLIVFSCREHSLALESKVMPTRSAIYRRRRLDLEIAALVDIQTALLGREVFAVLLSLLHSNWDNTRAGAYQILISLVQMSQLTSLPIPDEYTHSVACKVMESRGILLASSPRQREADTGTRLLGFLFRCFLTSSDRTAFLHRLVGLLGRRLMEMKAKLAAILTHKTDILEGRELPLAHGIIHVLRLVIESDTVFSDVNESEAGSDLKTLLQSMCSYFFQALRVSLAVVADVSKGEIVDGMDEEIAMSFGDTDREAYTKPINPGAIGANGIFSSVDRSTSDDRARQQASQRIVVGSWLLTKETCGALSSLLALRCVGAEEPIFNEAGTLLLSTLTSLKHTGAAFAAHRAIQTIAIVCLSKAKGSSIHQLPNYWSERLLGEVSKCEKIRDSTLRRSTGYALGFVALMKAESSATSQSPLCHRLISAILQLCLPSENHAELFMSKIELSVNEKKSLLQSFPNGSQFEFVSDCAYNIRTRIHALNSLRAILLDASLCREIFPFVGVAIIASVMGYVDSDWSIRNSSTMVFAAAIGRSIDPDKNALNKDVTGNNALSAQELFQAYPTLATFLLSVLNCGVNGKFQEPNMGMSLPPILPILLLLTRLQAASQSGMDSVALVEPFVPSILKCLGDKHISIRKGASRALRNSTSMARNSSTLIQSILLHCLSNVKILPRGNWNQVHGSLLAIHELVQDSHTAKAMVQESEIIDLLLRLTNVSEGAPMVPPICVAVAIQILLIVTSKDIYFNRCTGILSWLESTEDLVGGSALAVTVSSAATKVVCSTVWDSAITMREKEPFFDALLAMFCSRLADVRIAAVKAFKKDIYDGIDSISAHQSCHDVHDRLGTILLSSLSKELGKNFGNDLTHPPTVRRLLRCLLEILACGIWKSVDVGQRRDSFATCRRLAKLILSRHRMFDANVKNGGFTSLHGYCVELLSLCLLEQSSLTDIDDLAMVVSRLSDPSVHWRMRHSAAVALKGHTFFGATTDSASRPSEAFLRAWIACMQDEDADVRCAAAKVHNDARHQSDQFENTTSELLLIREFTSMGVANSSSVPWISFLSSVLIEQTYNLERIESVKKFNELAITPEGTPTSKSEPRNIFEAEQPNSYQEVCLIGQLCAVELSRVSWWSVQLDPVVRAQGAFICSEVLHCVDTVLSLICLQPHGLANVTLHMTRTNNMFPILHNVLLGAVAAVYSRMGGNNSSRRLAFVKSSARQIVTRAHTTAGLVHPGILAVIQALADAYPGCPSTLQSLRRCCFLLPVPDTQHQAAV